MHTAQFYAALVRYVALAAFITCTSSIAAFAQVNHMVNAGDRVRVSSASASGVFTVTAVEPGLLVVGRADSEGEYRVPQESIRKLSVSAGERSTGRGALRGAGFGLAIGGVGGAIAGFAEGSDPPCDTGFRFDVVFCETVRTSGAQKAGIGAVLFGAAGALVGGVFGALRPGERWNHVRHVNRITVAVTADGTMIGFVHPMF